MLPAPFQHARLSSVRVAGHHLGAYYLCNFSRRLRTSFVRSRACNCTAIGWRCVSRAGCSGASCQCIAAVIQCRCTRRIYTGIGTVLCMRVRAPKGAGVIGRHQSPHLARNLSGRLSGRGRSLDRVVLPVVCSASHCYYAKTYSSPSSRAQSS